MLNLKSYSFSGIGRFVEKQHIDLETRDNLIQIDGENQNTGGSSGAGKSTTVEALAYLLGISEIASTQLQSRITKSPIWVQGEFEGEITITRSKKDGLTIKTPEGTVSGNSKLAEEKLDEIIGVSRNLLKTMCYKRQKQGGFFLNLTPKESYNFLVECRNLKEFQGKVFKLEDVLKNQYKPRKIELNTSVEVMTESIETLKTLLSEKTIPLRPETAGLDEQRAELKVISQAYKNDCDVYQKSIDTLGLPPNHPTTPVFEKELQLTDLINLIAATKLEIVNIERERQLNIDQAVSGMSKLRSKITVSEGAQLSLERSQSTLTQKQEELKQQQESLSSFTAGDCPTCKREWDAGTDGLDAIKKKIKATEGDIEYEKNCIRAYQESVNELPQLKTMLEKTEEILATRQAVVVNVENTKILESLQENERVLQNEKDNIVSTANQAYLEVLNQYKTSKSVIEQGFNEKREAFREREGVLQSQISTTEGEIKAYEERKITYVTDFNNIEAKIKDSTVKLSSNQEELTKLERDILLSEESIRLIKNFTLQKFQDTLTYIGERATEIINMVPNMSNAVIYFDNAKETKSGNVKNEVNAVINLEGDSAIPIKTLSGGERTSADFAVDLAVGEMIESMTNKGVNFLILDEGFDGLDSISKIECLEILKSLNTDKKILIVDHSSEVKEMVSDIIKVKRINEESHVV